MKKDIKEMLMIVGLGLVAGGLMLIPESYSAVPIIIGGLIFGYGAGIK